MDPPSTKRTPPATSATFAGVAALDLTEPYATQTATGNVKSVNHQRTSPTPPWIPPRSLRRKRKCQSTQSMRHWISMSPRLSKINCEFKIVQKISPYTHSSSATPRSSRRYARATMMTTPSRPGTATDLPSSDMPTDRRKLMNSNTVTDNRHRVTMQPKDASAYRISTKATARVAALDRIYANVPTCMMDQHTGHPYPYTRERHRSTGAPTDSHHRRHQR